MRHLPAILFLSNVGVTAPCKGYAMTVSAAALLATLLGAVPAAHAQVRRNGDEYGGKNHQPTKAEVVGREHRDKVAPPPAQAGAEQRAVDKLDRQLLHDEKVDPPVAPSSR